MNFAYSQNTNHLLLFYRLQMKICYVFLLLLLLLLLYPYQKGVG